jgi:hypothetical protein
VVDFVSQLIESEMLKVLVDLLRLHSAREVHFLLRSSTGMVDGSYLPHKFHVIFRLVVFLSKCWITLINSTVLL